MGKKEVRFSDGRTRLHFKEIFFGEIFKDGVTCRSSMYQIWKSPVV